ncbi:MAG: hypothetical protein ACRC9N_02565 [Aeromonas sp.]
MKALAFLALLACGSAQATWEIEGDCQGISTEGPRDSFLIVTADKEVVLMGKGDGAVHNTTIQTNINTMEVTLYLHTSDGYTSGTVVDDIQRRLVVGMISKSNVIEFHDDNGFSAIYDTRGFNKAFQRLQACKE